MPFRERVRGFLDDPAELDALAGPAAPSRPAPVAGPTLATAYDRVGFLPGTARPVTSSQRTRTIGVAIPIPEPYGTRAAAASASPSATRWPRSIPTHITLLPPTDGRGRRPRRRSRSTCARSPSPSSRSTSTCAAPAPSTRCRRWCSCRWCSASATASGSSRGCAPARSARELAFPYHPHVTVAHDLPTTCSQRAFDEMADLRRAVPGLGLQPLRARRGRRVAPAARLPARAGRCRDPQRSARRLGHRRTHDDAGPGPRAAASRPRRAYPALDHAARMNGRYNEVRGSPGRRGHHVLRLPVVLPVAGVGVRGSSATSACGIPNADRTITDAVDERLPQPDRAGAGQIDISDVQSTPGPVPGSSALLGLLYAGLGWLDAVRIGMRRVFGTLDQSRSFVRARSWSTCWCSCSSAPRWSPRSS